MIVKNESHVILRSLSQLVKYIDYYIILDTISTDGTPELIKDFFDGQGIDGEIHYQKWTDDFGHARTSALELCRGKADWVFVFDADDILLEDLVLPEKLTADAYMCRFTNGPGSWIYWRNTIFRVDAGWKYIYALHEQSTCSLDNPVILPILTGLIHSGRDGARNLIENKYERDALILENALSKVDREKDLDAYHHYTYFLAQSYWDNDQYELAKKYYQLRIESSSKDEQTFRSEMQLVECEKELGSSEEELTMMFVNIAERYPDKIEPLWYAAQLHLKRENIPEACELLEKARHIRLPVVYMALEAELYEWKALYTLALLYESQDQIEKAHQAITQLLARTGHGLPSKEILPELLKLKLNTVPTIFPTREVKNDKSPHTLKISIYLVGQWEEKTWNSLMSWTDLHLVRRIVHLNTSPEPFSSKLNIMSILVKSDQVEDWRGYIKGDDYAVIIPTGYVFLDARDYILPSIHLLTHNPSVNRVIFNYSTKDTCQPPTVPYQVSPAGVRYLTLTTKGEVPAMYRGSSPEIGNTLAWYDVTNCRIPNYGQQLSGSYLVVANFDIATRFITNEDKTWQTGHKLVKKYHGIGFDTNGLIKKELLPSKEWIDMRDMGQSDYKVFILRQALSKDYLSWATRLNRTQLSLVLCRIIILIDNAAARALQQYYHQYDLYDVRLVTGPKTDIYLQQTANEVIDWSLATQLDPILQGEWGAIQLSSTALLVNPKGKGHFNLTTMRPW